MVDLDVFERRLARLENLLTDLRSLASMERSDFVTDYRATSLAERWLHLAIECALDLGHHLIAERGWPSPSTYRETFQILARQGVLTQKVADQMERWAGLRNILVHLYLDINHDILHGALRDEIGQLAEYAAAVAREAAR